MVRQLELLVPEHLSGAVPASKLDVLGDAHGTALVSNRGLRAESNSD